MSLMTVTDTRLAAADADISVYYAIKSFYPLDFEGVDCRRVRYCSSRVLHDPRGKAIASSGSSLPQEAAGSCTTLDLVAAVPVLYSVQY
jgi:hypothetical protein